MQSDITTVPFSLSTFCKNSHTYYNMIAKNLFNYFSVIVVSTDERSISVAWDYSCNHPGVFYKVYLEHLEWKACATGQKDNTRGPGTV